MTARDEKSPEADGVATGRGKDDLTKKQNRSKKEVLGYPLVRGFRRLLSQ